MTIIPPGIWHTTTLLCSYCGGQIRWRKKDFYRGDGVKNWRLEARCGVCGPVTDQSVMERVRALYDAEWERAYYDKQEQALADRLGAGFCEYLEREGREHGSAAGVAEKRESSV